MKHKANISIMLLMPVLLFIACKKELGNIKPIQLSSITVVNAITNSDPLIVSFFLDSPVNTYLNSTPQIGFQSFKEFSMPSGKTPFLTYQYSDTSRPVFNGSFDFNPSGVYSLFLYGRYNAQNPPDTLLTEDHPLYHPANDSTVGIRFINLFPADYAVNVATGGPGQGIQNLMYKGITQFNNYPITSSAPDPSAGYIFEFRSASTDSVLATFNYAYRNIARFKNVTIVLSAVLQGDETIAAAFLVNNY